MSSITFCILLGLVAGTFASLPAHYQSLSAAEKQSLLWRNVQSDPHDLDNLPSEGVGALLLNAIKPPYLVPAFSHVSDEMIEGRRKIFHTYGSVATGRLEMFANSTFTGIFESGTREVIIRPSVGILKDDNFIPGLGVKVLIDGQPSVNFHTLFSLDGQGDNRNFFENAMSNVIPDTENPVLIAVTKVFQTALYLLSANWMNRPENPNNMPLYEHASTRADGSAVQKGKVVAPWKIDFVPNKALSWNPSTTRDFRWHFATDVPAGSVLHDVVLFRTRESAGQHVGRLVTTSPFVASLYGDERLYLQHANNRWRST